ncbi:hypothetical protein [Labilibaculum euxinus]|uniref:Uncharacterized protein n=1 Tax=Labilibaculum euxinus TaxID=2686357 RepID=A0A7M4D4U5_9BACT|nr:hypothetical protein [Labilibaculum euxinus]MUP37674.1 hypothetical protein [Labilibaculum euxinus]MVB06879.1 hypothetical protein [Labilibaculum euxinus]
MKKLILIWISLLFIFTSCDEKYNEEDASITNSSIIKSDLSTNVSIPYSNESTLAEFKNDLEVVDYQFARKLAMLELDASGFRQDMGWDGCIMSKLPVVIYGFDSKPKYYEFFLKDGENKEVGSVTIDAKRRSGAIINEVRGEIRDYNTLYSKSDPGMKLIADWSGYVYIGVISKSGETPISILEPQTGERLEMMRELKDEEIYEELAGVVRFDNTSTLDKLEPETSEKIREIDTIKLQVQLDSLHVDMVREQVERDAYWDVITTYADSIKTLEDEEILKSETKGWFSRVFKRKSSSSVVLSEYQNNLKFKKGGWCGPWAMNWIYNTKKGGDKYSHFDSWASTLGPVGWGARVLGSHPMFPKEMCVSMGLATNWKIIVKPHFSSGRRNAYNFIRDKKNPVVILCKGGSHWKVGYGCYKKGNWLWNNYYFASMDNGNLNIKTDKPYYHRSSWFMLFVKVYD